MSEETATLRGSAQKLSRMVEWASLGGVGDPYHGDLYTRVTEDSIEFIAGSQGNVVVAYCDFDEGFVEDIELDGTDELEAIIQVSDFFNCHELATDGGTTEFRLIGDDDKLAKKMVFDAQYESWALLPGSEAVLEEVPINVPKRFDENDVMMNSEGEKLSVQVETDVAALQDIKEFVDFDPESDFYPVVIEDGDFKIEAGSERSRGGRGRLIGKVTGDTDVRNKYNEGFEELAGTLSGEIRIVTDENAPLSIVQDVNGGTLRHMIGNVG